MVRSFSYNYHQYMGSIKLLWSVVGKHTIVYVWKGFENNTRAFFKLLLYKLKVISKKWEYLISRNVDNWFQLNLKIGPLKHVCLCMTGGCSE